MEPFYRESWRRKRSKNTLYEITDASGISDGGLSKLCGSMSRFIFTKRPDTHTHTHTHTHGTYVHILPRYCVLSFPGSANVRKTRLEIYELVSIPSEWIELADV